MHMYVCLAKRPGSFDNHFHASDLHPEPLAFGSAPFAQVHRIGARSVGFGVQLCNLWNQLVKSQEEVRREQGKARNIP